MARLVDTLRVGIPALVFVALTFAGCNDEPISLTDSPGALQEWKSNSNPGVFPPQSRPYGSSLQEWTAEWWRWALSIPLDQNPILDTTGAFSDGGQSGPVYYLAGTFGGAVTRSCTVPSGKAILFPIVNYLSDYPCPDTSFHPSPGQSLEDFLAEGAAFIMGFVTDLEVEVDGNPLQDLTDHRAVSELFDFTADISWQTLDPCITGSMQEAVSDGYWVMLTPLSVGVHTLHFRGLLEFPDGGSFEVEATYNLTIVP